MYGGCGGFERRELEDYKYAISAWKMGGKRRDSLTRTFATGQWGGKR